MKKKQKNETPPSQESGSLWGDSTLSQAPPAPIKPPHKGTTEKPLKAQTIRGLPPQKSPQQGGSLLFFAGLLGLNLASYGVMPEIWAYVGMASGILCATLVHQQQQRLRQQFLQDKEDLAAYFQADMKEINDTLLALSQVSTQMNQQITAECLLSREEMDKSMSTTAFALHTAMAGVVAKLADHRQEVQDELERNRSKVADLLVEMKQQHEEQMNQLNLELKEIISKHSDASLQAQVEAKESLGSIGRELLENQAKTNQSMEESTTNGLSDLQIKTIELENLLKNSITASEESLLARTQDLEQEVKGLLYQTQERLKQQSEGVEGMFAGVSQEIQENISSITEKWDTSVDKLLLNVSQVEDRIAMDNLKQGQEILIRFDKFLVETEDLLAGKHGALSQDFQENANAIRGKLKDISTILTEKFHENARNTQESYQAERQLWHKSLEQGQKDMAENWEHTKDYLQVKLDKFADTLEEKLEDSACVVYEKLEDTYLLVEGNLESTSETLVGKLDTATGTMIKKLDNTWETVERKLDTTSETLVGKLDTTSETLVGKLDTTSETLVGKLDTTSETLVGKLDDTSLDIQEQWDDTRQAMEKKLDGTREILGEKWDNTRESLHDRFGSVTRLMQDKFDVVALELSEAVEQNAQHVHHKLGEMDKSVGENFRNSAQFTAETLETMEKSFLDTVDSQFLDSKRVLEQALSQSKGDLADRLTAVEDTFRETLVEELAVSAKEVLGNVSQNGRDTLEKLGDMEADLAGTLEQKTNLLQSHVEGELAGFRQEVKEEFTQLSQGVEADVRDMSHYFRQTLEKLDSSVVDNQAQSLEVLGTISNTLSASQDFVVEKLSEEIRNRLEVQSAALRREMEELLELCEGNESQGQALLETLKKMDEKNDKILAEVLHTMELSESHGENLDKRYDGLLDCLSLQKERIAQVVQKELTQTTLVLGQEQGKTAEILRQEQRKTTESILHEQGKLLGMVRELGATGAVELPVASSTVEEVHEEGRDIKHHRDGGKLVKSQIFSEGSLLYEVVYDSQEIMSASKTFDRQGNLMLEQDFYPSGECRSRVEYVMKEDGLRKITSQFDENGKKIDHVVKN